MDKIKKFINVHIPISNCTLRCHYCYVTLNQTFGHPMQKLDRSPEFIKSALSKNRLGGCCHLNLCADGETLLMPNIIDYINALLDEGHIISIVSNCTLTNKINDLVALSEEQKKHLFIKASYHYLELIRTGLLDTFFDNLQKLHNAGISLTIEVTPSDELIPFADEAVQICKERMGAIPHFTIARDGRYPELPILTSMSRNDYRNTWGKYGSSLFEFKESIFGKPVHVYCHAGDWFFNLNLMTGEISQCYGTPAFQNIYANIDEPIHFKPIGKHCPEKHCYNGHALFTLGVVPQVQSPTYAEVRDKIMKNSEHWLLPEIQSLFSQRLYENNHRYSIYKRSCIYFKNLIRKVNFIHRKKRIK